MLIEVLAFPVSLYGNETLIIRLMTAAIRVLFSTHTTTWNNFVYNDRVLHINEISLYDVTILTETIWSCSKIPEVQFSKLFVFFGD